MGKAHDPEYLKPSKPKVMLFGPYDTDKSRFCCGFPNSIYIDAENGASESQYIRSLKESNSKYMGVADGARNLKEVIAEVKSLIVSPGDRQNLIIDSVSELIDVSDAQEQEKLGDDKKDPFSSYKKAGVRHMRRLAMLIGQLDMAVIMVSHSKDKWEGEGETRKVTGVTFDAWPKLGYKINLQLQSMRVGGVTFSRVIRSKYESMIRGQEIPMTYDAFSKAFGKEIMDRKPQGIVPATAAQVAEITHMVGILNIEDEELTGWLNKDGAEVIEDLPTDRAVKMIEFLNKKIKGDTK
jgi:hypothetical protein